MSPFDTLFAGVAVSDITTGSDFYARLLGRPADVVVHDHEVMWRVAEGAWLYVVVDPPRAGRGLVTLAVPDLAAAVAELAGRGVAVGDVEAVGDAGHKATVDDPDGNAVSLIQVR